jgi:hypothetical protein
MHALDWAGELGVAFGVVGMACLPQPLSKKHGDHDRRKTWRDGIGSWTEGGAEGRWRPSWQRIREVECLRHRTWTGWAVRASVELGNPRPRLPEAEQHRPTRRARTKRSSRTTLTVWRRQSPSRASPRVMRKAPALPCCSGGSYSHGPSAH